MVKPMTSVFPTISNNFIVASYMAGNWLLDHSASRVLGSARQ